MEYMAMLAEPGLVSRLQELIDDKEPEVVKRTIRVFTNVYRHSLALVASGELQPQKYEQSYAEISAVSNKLIAMLKTAENEGIVVHLVRYLEAALVSHILADLSQFPHIAQMTAPVLKKGVDALLEFVKTPYVGGSAFCVAIRALISVACYQVNLRPCITELAEDLINTPPPNLFDHNIRSFHKTLQRNLFRLLKRAEVDGDKERLVNLMVKVGVPRRRLAEFVPRSKKRSSPPTIPEPGSSSRLSPPSSKRIRLAGEEIVRFRPSSSIELTPEEIRRFGPQSLPKQLRHCSSLEKILSDEPKEIPLEPKPKAPVSITSILDRILSDVKMPSVVPAPGPGAALLRAREKLISQGRGSNSPPLSRRNSLDDGSKSMEVSSKESLTCQLPNNDLDDSSPRSPSPPATESETQSEFERTILNLKLEKEDNLSDECAIPFSVKCSLKEGMIYEKLDCNKVVDILLASPCELPSEMPDSLKKTFIYDLKIMREKLAVALSSYLRDEDFCSRSTLSTSDTSDRIQSSLNTTHLKKPSAKRRFSDDTDDKCHAKLEQTSHSLNNSPVRGNSPIRDLLFSGQDVDLRQQLRNLPGAGMRGFPARTHSESVPVNTSTSSVNSSVSKVTDSPASPGPSESIFNRDPRLVSQTSEREANVDPRLQKTNFRKSVSPPSISAPETSSRDPRLARKCGNNSVSADIGAQPSAMYGTSLPQPAGVPYSTSVFTNPTNSLPDAAVKAPTRDPRLDSLRDPRGSTYTSSNTPHNIPGTSDVNNYVDPNARDPRGNFNSVSGHMQGVGAGLFSKVNNQLDISIGNSQIMPPLEYRQTVYPELQRSNLDPRRKLSIDPRQNSNMDPHQNLNIEPRQNPNMDPRQKHSMDPRQIPNVDPRQIPNMDPRQNLNVIPLQIPNVGPRQNPNVDPRQNFKGDLRQVPNIDPRHGSHPDMRRSFNMGVQQPHNMGVRHGVAPRHGANDVPLRPHRQPLLGAPPLPLGFRGTSIPLLQTPTSGQPPMPPLPVYAGAASVSTFDNSYALSRYASGESRNRF